MSLSRSPLPVQPPQTLAMQTRAGNSVRLDADVYYPVGEGPFPVLLMRQPYGRAIASTVVYAHPTWYAAQGYIVVIQDVRGRGTSEGEFRLFETEIEDGEDAVDWAANLPNSNGHVGMYGFSYQGMTQLYAAVNRPEPLKTICPAMLAYDLYQDWAYENDAFCLQANLGWALQLAAETARRNDDESSFLELAQAAKQLPLHDRLPAYPEILSRLAPDSFYHDWVSRSPQDPYWAKLSPKTYCDRFLDLPMLHIGGWFDPYLRGTLNLYQALQATAQAPQHLIIGAWGHLPWGRKVGAIDYGTKAVSDCDRAQIRWFDRWLKPEVQRAEAPLPAPAIQLFILGKNDWWSPASLPSGFHAAADREQPTSEQPTSKQLTSEQTTGVQAWQLLTTGLTSIRGSDLIPQGTDVVSRAMPDAIVHDPWRPVPALGGHAAVPAGCFDRALIDSRSDVLTYTTAPFTAVQWLLGQVRVDVTCAADQPSFDLCAVLSEVYPDGSVYPLSQGYLCITQPPATGEVSLPLQPIAAQIPMGHALRLSLSAACFPAYPVNSGSGVPPRGARAIDAKIITITIEKGRVQIPIGSNLPS
ncbi:MAG: CocE/NonD family hydrolase [Synechococcales bacterium]|nr:CocE/NonD family hydrolase [Synechococcales bacterium]